MTQPSLWQLGRTEPELPPLDGDLDADVVVIGAGITGLTVATMLVRDGRKVVVLEARDIGSGTSGSTTAKVTALQGTRYRTITNHHGPDTAAAYAWSQLDALAWMEAQVRDHALDCRWEHRPAITYATTLEGRSLLDEELAAARASGLAVSQHDDIDLPFPNAGGIVLEGQAQFDPVPYLRLLAEEIDAAPNGAIHCRSRVTAVKGLGDHVVHTSSGARVRARHVVVATLLPIVDRGLFFARATPTTSYLVAMTATDHLPHGMFLSAESPARSIRTAHHDGEDLVLVGGESHPTGRGGSTAARYDRLVSWARRELGAGDVRAQWSAHDYSPADHLPWVGSSSPATPRVLTASGFEKWGMTMATASALALRDHIRRDETGEPATSTSTSDWAGVFNPARLTVAGALGSAKINAEVARDLVTSWVNPSASVPSGADVVVERRGVLPLGRERTDGDGTAAPMPGRSARSAGTPAPGEADRGVVIVCTHLGGICSWNDAERTWDCPLHGSRFGPEGDVLTGPATRPLSRSD